MPAGDLSRYLQVLQRLQSRLEEGARSDRFKPPENFALAQVRLGDHATAPVIGEIVDISPEGMKLALEGGLQPGVGERCHLDIGEAGQECFELEGEVRWVESHPLITVIGVQLRLAQQHEGPRG